MAVYPLKFEPILKPMIWGGRRLAELFGKPIALGAAIGESWELVDLPQEQSRVAWGPSKGRTLHELVQEWGRDLVGGAGLIDGRFPVLIKFLDARDNLSIQVHPPRKAGNDAAAGPAKHEWWYIIDAAPDGVIYKGLKPGVNRETLAAACQDGAVPQLLHCIPVKPDDAHELPAGVVHALGAGVVVAEVQTPSQVTYRLFDWNRVDPQTGQPRALHVREGLDCIDFGAAGPPRSAPRSHVASLWTTVSRLVANPWFTVEKVRMIEGLKQEIPYAEPVIWLILRGKGRIACGGISTAVEFAPGDCVLLPAGMKNGVMETLADCVWLEITLPIPSDLSQYERPSAEALRAQQGTSRAPAGIHVDPELLGKKREGP